MFAPTEADARRIWLVSPYISSFGKPSRAVNIKRQLVRLLPHLKILESLLIMRLQAFPESYSCS